MPRTRLVPLLLIVLPILLFGVALLRPVDRADRLFPALGQPATIARIELARGTAQVVLARRADTGDWAVLSAADAPGDARRIDALLDALARARTWPLPDGQSADPREPVELRLTRADGSVAGHVGVWEGQAERRDAGGRPEGARLAVSGLPALPLWQSAWAAIEMPELAAASVARMERLDAGARIPVDPAATAETALALERLGQQDFVAAALINWAGARLYRLTLADGTAIDLQAVPEGKAGWRIRITSDDRADVRLVRAYAFLLPVALP